MPVVLAGMYGLCISEILGHTLKGIGMFLGISNNLEAVTAQYVDVRLERKKSVLEIYHKALHQQKNAEKEVEDKSAKRKACQMLRHKTGL